MNVIHEATLGVMSVAAVLTIGCSDGATRLVAPQKPTVSAMRGIGGSDTIPNSFLVMFRRDSARDAVATERLIEGFSKRFGGRIKFRYDALRGYAVDGMPADVAARIAREPAIAYVEPDVVMYPAVTQFNPGVGLDRINQDYLPLDQVYDFGSGIGAGVHVYIIDTGVDSLNPEFAGRIGNGKSCVSQGGPYTSLDTFGHGTAVASVAAGATFGVARNATIHSIRISGDAAGTSTTSIETCGINWLATYGITPAVANMSFTGDAFAVGTAISNVINAGISFVKAAGNSSIDAYQDRGNRAFDEIVVGATDPTNDAFASFSNFGTTVTMLAPGVNVLVADKYNPGYGKLGSGTSFSAPYVAGVAAALLAAQPTWTPAQIFYEMPLHESVSGVVSGLPAGTPNKLLVKHNL